MSTREKKIHDAAEILTGEGPPTSSARARVEHAHSKVEALTAAGRGKIKTTLSMDSERTLQRTRQDTGE